MRVATGTRMLTTRCASSADSKSDSWLGLLRHLRGHGVKAEGYGGTWPAEQSRNEEREKERTRYQANAQKKKKKQKKKGSWTHRQRTNAEQHTKDTHHDGAPWVEALCWVKAVADGARGRPLVFGGLVADGPPKFGGKADHAADEKTEETEAQSAVGDNVLVPAAIPIVDVPSSADEPSRSGSSGGTFEQLVAEICTMVATLKTDPTTMARPAPREAAVQALCPPTSQRRPGVQTRGVAQRPGHGGRRGPRVCGPPRRRQKQSKGAAKETTSGEWAGCSTC